MDIDDGSQLSHSATYIVEALERVRSLWMLL